MTLRAIAVCIFGCTLAGTTAAADPVGAEYLYKTVGDRELRLYINRPDNSENQRPCLVFFHGGGWTGGKPGQFTEHSKYFVTRGLVCIQVEYRLLQDRQEPPTVCIQDARSAMRWVRAHAAELGVDPQRIGSAGGSAGGHLAAFVGMVDGLDDPKDDLAISPKSNAMVLFNPVFDNGPDGYGYQRTGDRYAEFSPFHNVSANDPPAIVFLGTKDQLIPVSTLEKFAENMNSAGVRCETMLFDGKPHGFFNYGRDGNRDYTETVIAADRFLASLGWIEGEPTLERPE